MEKVCAFSFDDAGAASAAAAVSSSSAAAGTRTRKAAALTVSPSAATSTQPAPSPTSSKGGSGSGGGGRPRSNSCPSFPFPATLTAASSGGVESLRAAANNCVKGFQLLAFDAAPAWMQDNPFILRGYRAHFSWRQSFLSLCRLHNETLNVWTHFVGFLSVLMLLIFTMNTLSPFGIDHLSWSAAPSTGVVDAAASAAAVSTALNSCPLSSFAQLYQATQPPMSPWIQTRPEAVRESVPAHHLRDAMESLLSHLPHVPTMAEIARSVRDQAEAVTDAMKAGSLSEVQKNARLRFSEYMKSLHDALSSFRQAVTELQSTSGVAALNKLQVAREMVATSPTLAALLPTYSSDVSAFARSIVQDFKNTYLKNVTEEAEFLFLPMPVDGSTVHPYLSRWPLAVFMLSAMACLLFSAVFHLFTSVSLEASLVLQSLDFAGICLLCAGSNIPVTYYGFYCLPFWRDLYIGIMTSLGAVGFFITTAPRFRANKYRTLRALVFIILGLSGVIPFGHLLLHHQEWLSITWYLLGMGAFYLGGAALYTFHIPERWFPGRFDIFGHSHQLWHCCVFAAVCVHYVGCVHFYQWRMNRVCVV